MSFCGLINGISLKICILCVRVKIPQRSFEPFCVWFLFQNASSHSVVVVVVFVGFCLIVCFVFRRYKGKQSLPPF